MKYYLNTLNSFSISKIHFSNLIDLIAASLLSHKYKANKQTKKLL